jgi:hypothetical protein
MPKRRVLAFGITPQTHNTRTTTHCRRHIAQCYPLGVRWRRVGSRLQLGETRMGPQHRQNGGQRRERHLGRSWRSLEWHVASSGRALLPAVRKPTKPAKSSDAKKSIYAKREAYLLLLPCCALDEGFQVAFGSAHGMWSDTKVMIRKAKAWATTKGHKLTCSTYL